MKRLNSEDARVQGAIAHYKSGHSVKSVCMVFKMDGEALRRVLIDLGILRTRQKAAQLAKSGKSIRDNCFDKLTPEVCYWIGFLYADGHIEKSRPRITVTLHPNDKTHMEKFASFVGCNTLKVTGKYYRVAFSSQKIYDRLMSLGFNNRKTWEIIPHKALKNSSDFWRGVFDGDGWIFNGKQICVGLSGRETTLKEFLFFINACGVNTKTNPHKDPRRNFLWKMDLHSHKAIRTAHLLYKNATVYLDRKYKIYIEQFCDNEEIQ